MEKELWKYLKETEKPIVLYGMGNGADKIINVLESKGISYRGVFASDGFVRNKEFHGHKISSYKDLKEKFGDMIVLLCFGSQREEVIANVKRISKEQELFSPEVPVFGGGLFDEEYLKQNADDFKWVYERLADDWSRKTFENIIKYKLSGKLDFLFDCEVSEDEPYESFLKLSNNENFLDLGAYTGDTVKDFIDRTDDYTKITAVEPDFKTFKKLIKNTEEYKNIHCINKGISDSCKTGFFAMNSGRNSAVSDNGLETEFISVDSLKDSFTLIKMDVEGEEIPAINGAIEIITKLKPKMQIAAYHRTDDLLSIPKAVFEKNNDYKLYIRHFKSVPAWDTNYYFI